MKTALTTLLFTLAAGCAYHAPEVDLRTDDAIRSEPAQLELPSVRAAEPEVRLECYSELGRDRTVCAYAGREDAAPSWNTSSEPSDFF